MEIFWSILASVVAGIITTILGYILGIINNRRHEKISTIKRVISYLSYYQNIEVNNSNREKFMSELNDIHNLLLCNFPESLTNKIRKQKSKRYFVKNNNDNKKYKSKWLFDYFMTIEINIFAQLRVEQPFRLTESIWTDGDINLKQCFYLTYYKMIHPICSMLLRKTTIIDSYKSI